MILAVVTLVVASVLAWWSVADRMSPLAMYVVEAEGVVGFPLWIPFAVVGLFLLVRAVRAAAAKPELTAHRRETRESLRPRQSEPSPSGGEPPRADAASPRSSRLPGQVGRTEVAAADGWRAVIDTRALRLPVGPQGKVRIDEVPEVPYTLVLNSVTPQQARHRLALFAELLSGMPTPPVARVRLESCPDIGGPVHKLLSAELTRFFVPEAFHVVSRADGADIRFAMPDPRWFERHAGAD